MLAEDDNDALVAAVPVPTGAAEADPAAPSAAPAAASPAPPEPVADAPAAAPPSAPAAEPAPAPAGAEPLPTVQLAGAEALEAEAAGGLLGRLKERVGHTVERVSEIERVRKSVEFVVDTSKAVGQKVGENERVQQGYEFVKKKTAELAESERVQKGLEYAKDTAKAVSEKTHRGLEVVSETTQMGLEYAKEKTRAVREGAGTVWEKGAGSIQRVRAQVGKVAWRGSARETLDIAAREEQWRGIKVQGAEELSVPARTEHTSAYHVAKGSTLRWTFRVKDYDIGFAVRMRVQEWGGSREEEVLGVERYDSTDTISGSWVADEARTIVLAFDNRYSRLRAKTVAYLVGTEKPPDC